jgi:hypothetical protein
VAASPLPVLDEAAPLPTPDIKVEFAGGPIGVVDDPDDADDEDDSMTAVYLSVPLAFLVFVTRISFDSLLTLAPDGGDSSLAAAADADADVFAGGLFDTGATTAAGTTAAADALFLFALC